MKELSLFTGYGGFSLGLRLAGLETRCVGYVEIEPYCQEIIKARIKDGYLGDAPVWGNISTLNGWQFRGVVDIITAGFPCQPHSVAGHQRGADDERNLWPETLRIIREVRPRYVLLENVAGILSASRKRGTPAYGGTVVGELAQAGYRIRWETVGADDVGAPHRRKRWLCFGELANSDSNGTEWNQSADRERSGLEQGRQELADSDSYGEGKRHNSDTKRGHPREIPEGRDSQSTQDKISYAYNGGGSTDELADPKRGGRIESRVRRGVGRVHRTTQDYPSPAQESDSWRISELGNSDITGSQGRQQPLRGSAYEPPAWPPSPSDTVAWERVLRELPCLAPALSKEAESQFRGVDNGRSHRVDELKALGNGIVPAVAAEFLQRINFAV